MILWNFTAIHSTKNMWRMNVKYNSKLQLLLNSLIGMTTLWGIIDDLIYLQHLVIEALSELLKVLWSAGRNKTSEPVIKAHGRSSSRYGIKAVDTWERNSGLLESLEIPASDNTTFIILVEKNFASWRNIIAFSLMALAELGLFSHPNYTSAFEDQLCELWDLFSWWMWQSMIFLDTMTNCIRTW